MTGDGGFTKIVPPPGAARILTVNAFVGSVGTGLFLTGSVLYYTRALHLSVLSVGIALSVAGAVGMVASVLIGTVADRVGPRPTMVGLHLFRVGGYTALAFVQSYWQFLLVVVLVTCADRSGPPTNQALIGRIFDKSERVRANAYMRAVRNIGLAVGALLAGTAVQVGTLSAYRLLVLGNALSFLPMSFLIASLARYERRSAAQTGGADAARGVWRVALRDKPFVALAFANGAVMLHDSILFVALPLWIVDHTAAPPFMVSTVLVINTVLTAGGQVLWTRLTTTPRAAARVMTGIGIVLAGACCVFAAAHYGNAVVASVVVVVGVILLTVGENLHAAAAWEISYDLAPPKSQATYLAVFNLGSNAQDMCGPVVVTGLGVAAGVVGWFGIAAIFLVSTTAMRALATVTSASRQARAGADDSDTGRATAGTMPRLTPPPPVPKS